MQSLSKTGNGSKGGGMKSQTFQLVRNHTTLCTPKMFVSINANGYFADIALMQIPHFAHTFRGACEMCVGGIWL